MSASTAKPSLMTFNAVYEIEVNIAMILVIAMLAASTVMLLELDTIALDAVDHAEMVAVEPHDLHVLFDSIP